MQKISHCIVGVMVSLLASGTVAHGSLSWVKPKTIHVEYYYKIGICCFSTKNAALSNQSKDLESG